VDDTIVIDEIMYQKFPEKRLLTWSDAMEYSNWLNISNIRTGDCPELRSLRGYLQSRFREALGVKSTS